MANSEFLANVCYENHTPTTGIYTLSLHDALPIYNFYVIVTADDVRDPHVEVVDDHAEVVDRRSTRLNSSHVAISYAVFCLKKKSTHHAVVITDEAGRATWVTASFFQLNASPAATV